MKRKRKIFYTDEEGNIIDEEEVGWLGYDFEEVYGFNENLSQKEQKTWDTVWDDYQKTGRWNGNIFQKTPSLDYKYIEQMVNTLAAQYNIEVRIGSTWQVDVCNKILTYNPLSLVDETKSRLIALILHEIGHIRHSTDRLDLEQKDKIDEKYSLRDDNVFLILNLFEDIRIDNLMMESYESAKDIYEDNKSIINKIAAQYLQHSVKIKEKLVRDLKSFFDSDKNEIENMIIQRPTVYEYSAGILLKAYDEKNDILNDNLILKEKIEKTKQVIELCKKCPNTLSLLLLIRKLVFPFIEDLLQDMKDIQNTAIDGLQDNLNSNSIVRNIETIIKKDKTKTENYHKTTLEGILKEVNYYYSNNIKDILLSDRITITGIGNTKSKIPDKWRNGDYDALKDSVSNYIQELTKKLTFLKREETTKRYVKKMKTGKIDVKRIYKFLVSNDSRVFARKQESQDTIKSFAFSFMLDISGSMTNRDKIIHTIRACILLAEIFTKMKIPFELILFGSSGKSLKKFSDSYSKIKGQLAGLARKLDGSTRLLDGLELLSLQKQEEINKILIILSDGEVDEENSCKEKIDQLKKDFNIKPIGIGLLSHEIKTLLGKENGIEIDNVADLPNYFSRMLKDLVDKAKNKKYAT